MKLVGSVYSSIAKRTARQVAVSQGWIEYDTFAFPWSAFRWLLTQLSNAYTGDSSMLSGSCQKVFDGGGHITQTLRITDLQHSVLAEVSYIVKPRLALPGSAGHAWQRGTTCPYGRHRLFSGVALLKKPLFWITISASLAFASLPRSSAAVCFFSKLWVRRL